MSKFNEWFLSLEEGRKRVLADDKWMLAEAAFSAHERELAELRAFKQSAEAKIKEYERVTQLSGEVNAKLVGELLDRTVVEVPNNFGIIPMRNGKPDITERMKVDCIGEFYWKEEAPYYDRDGELHDYVATHAVPWDLCKEIYKRMASVAMLAAAQSNGQQSSETLPSKTAGEFISITDRMPEIGEYVLLMTDRYWNTPDGVPDMRVAVTGYLADLGGLYWYIFGERGMKIDAFTHWMPIKTPKNYNDEAEGA